MQSEFKLLLHSDVTIKIYETVSGLLISEKDIDKSDGERTIIFIGLNEVQHTVEVFGRNSGIMNKNPLLSVHYIIPVKAGIPVESLQEYKQ